MENQLFMNVGIPPPPLQFEPSSSSSMPAWQCLSSTMEIQASVPNFSSQRVENSFRNPNREKSTDHGVHFESALSSMVSSPASSNLNICNDNFIIRELIEKLGSIGACSGEISLHSLPIVGASSYINGSNSTSTSSYTTPLSSPPKMNIPHLVKENLPNLAKSVALNSSVAEFSADPEFAERAAKFSCFGSRNFNGRTGQFVTNKNNAELTQRSTPLTEPVLKEIGSQMENKNSPMELANSQEESTLSEQHPKGEIGVKPSNDVNSRKRKASCKGKAKETSTSTNPPKAAEVSEDSYAKRSKPNENEGNENGGVAEEESKGREEKQNMSNSKLAEPPKDYIHVRARRGQATDSHSLAERVRREKISERMKLLQDLVPGCNKVTGKAVMLDEIINYVQSLQRQVEFLSMKLASVNTRLDFSVDNLSKSIFGSNNSLANPIFPPDSSAQAFYGHHQPQPNSAVHNNISTGNVNHSSVDLLDTTPLCQKLSTQLPTSDGFNELGPQYPPTFSEDDLQAIVQMGFGQSANRKTSPGSNQAANMKVEH